MSKFLRPRLILAGEGIIAPLEVNIMVFLVLADPKVIQLSIVSTDIISKRMLFAGEFARPTFERSRLVELPNILEYIDALVR